jgi:hypothetical protein
MLGRAPASPDRTRTALRVRRAKPRAVQDPEPPAGKVGPGWDVVALALLAALLRRLRAAARLRAATSARADGLAAQQLVLRQSVVLGRSPTDRIAGPHFVLASRTHIHLGFRIGVPADRTRSCRLGVRSKSRVRSRRGRRLERAPNRTRGLRPPIGSQTLCVAEGEGFEPPMALETLPVSKTRTKDAAHVVVPRPHAGRAQLGGPPRGPPPHMCG